MTNQYLPEGMILGTAENREYITSLSGLQRAMNEGVILESTVLLCDSAMRLHVDLYGVTGIIEREECVFCRDGEELKDIAVITRVGKPICFKVINITFENGKAIAHLSRRMAQKDCIQNRLSDLISGDIIQAKVTHMENFGAFVDIGCGVASLLSVDCISVSRISHPSDRLRVGDVINVVIKSIDHDTGRIFVSMRELLGTWEENASLFEAGQTVAGIVRSIENYGVFIELTPNLAGLAELRDDIKDREIAEIGKTVAVYIKSIIPDRMKIKLVLIDSYKGDTRRSGIEYFVDCKNTFHLNSWRYSTPNSRKIIETLFDKV
ncbi:MAG: S1 RNA-binding domain-containing protein [Ruminococcaceae bacterium]|nr:S1 RNA-binding domain-containing protein [Oscillospiraceae bacterium]